MMKTIEFNTNINCDGCIAKVTPGLDSTVGKGNWKVDTGNSEKTLIVQSENVSESEIEDVVKKLGFNIQLKNVP
jgi:copper chaperone